MYRWFAFLGLALATLPMALAHLLPQTDSHRDEVTASIARSFAGPITFAADGLHVVP